MALGTQFALSNSRILLKTYKLPHYDLVERHQPKAFCPYCSIFCWGFPNPNANTRWLIYCECNIDLREWCLLSSGPLNFANLFNFVKQKNYIMIALKWLLIRKSLFIHNDLALNEWIKYVFRIKHALPQIFNWYILLSFIFFKNCWNAGKNSQNKRHRSEQKYKIFL